MSDVSQKIKDDMRQTIKDIFGDKDKYHTIDLEVASEVIITFIFANFDEDTITEDNRFEIYYEFLGKAAAIAQGWKQNGADKINLPSQTEQNLRSYIKGTYGDRIL